MSPEVEAEKVIAISLGKIASSRVQRGGPKLCKNLLVANLIYRARTLVDGQEHCYHGSYDQNHSSSPDFQSSNSTCGAVLNESCGMTEVPSVDGELTSVPFLKQRQEYEVKDLKRILPSTFHEHDNKENDSPDLPSDLPSEISRNQTSFRTRPDTSLTSKPCGILPRRLKRRNSSEGKGDYETHRSPSKKACEPRLHKKLVDDELFLPDNGDSDSDFDVDGMDVEQISTLVSAFSNSFRDFSCVSRTASDAESLTVPEKNTHSSLWRSSSVPDMVFCAQQATSVLKMRQQSFETSTAVLA